MLGWRCSPRTAPTRCRRSRATTCSARSAPLVEALEREGARLGGRAVLARSGRGSTRRDDRVGAARERAPAGAAHARPLRPPHRRGRVPSGLARADAARRSARAARARRGASREPGAHVARAALFMLAGAGRGGPRLPDLDDATPRCRRCAPQPRLAAEWEPRLTSRSYDSGLRPPPRSAARSCGMAMTEKQGGSDVRANTTRARRPQRRAASTSSSGTSGSARRRCATRSWCSRRRRRGLSCFLLPRVLPDGTRNAFRIQRLKDKLGNRSNASSEIEFDGALGAARRRGGPRRADDHRDGRPHAARLRARLGGRDARRRSAQAMHHARAPQRVRQAARRPAADAQRARRPRVESEAATVPRCGSRAPTTDARDDAPRPRSRGSRPRSASTGSASAGPATRRRRWSASAATATSRSPACRGSTARRR